MQTRKKKKCPLRRADRLRVVKGGLPELSLEPFSHKGPAQIVKRDATDKLRTNWKRAEDAHIFLYHQSSMNPSLSKEEVYKALQSEVMVACPKIMKKQNKAAVTIQCAFRVRSARSILLQHRQQYAATKIQAAFRAVKPRRMLQWNCSALKIQTIWRGFGPKRARKTALMKLERQKSCATSATTIQTQWRMISARDIFRQYKSARTIQAAWRGYANYRNYVNYKAINKAATAIQTVWRSFKASLVFIMIIYDIITVQRIARGYIARRQRAREHCTIQIQRITRGRLQRKIFAVLWTRHVKLTSATNIQRVFRGHRGRRRATRNKRIRRSAIAIQKCWRGYDAQQNFWFTIGSVIAIQSLARGRAVRRQGATELHSAIIMQCAIRMWRATSVLRQLQHSKLIFTSASLIQAFWRSHVVHQKYLQLLHTMKAATTIQSAWRGFVSYSDYMFTLDYVITIQRVFRGFCGRRYFAAKYERRERRRAINRLRHESALNIQRVFRGSICRVRIAIIRRNALRRNSAVAIQSMWRCYEAQDKLFTAVGSSIVIQARVRGMIGRIWYIDVLGSVIVAQSAVRRWIASRRVAQRRLVAALLAMARSAQLQKESAAKTLQSFYRIVIHPKVVNRAATKMQSFFRMVRAMVDREIEEETKRRKIRKMLRNRTREVDEMMLEDAWISMPSSSASSNASFRSNEKSRKRLSKIQRSEIVSITSDNSANTSTLIASMSSDNSLKHMWESVSLSEASVCEVKRVVTTNTREGRSKGRSLLSRNTCSISPSTRTRRIKFSKISSHCIEKSIKGSEASFGSKSNAKGSSEGIQANRFVNSSSSRVASCDHPPRVPKKNILPPSYSFKDDISVRTGTISSEGSLERPFSPSASLVRTRPISDTSNMVSALTTLTDFTNSTKNLAAHRTNSISRKRMSDDGESMEVSMDSGPKVTTDQTENGKRNKKVNANRGKSHFELRARSRTPQRTLT